MEITSYSPLDSVQRNAADKYSFSIKNRSFQQHCLKCCCRG